jgi:hypothetical protein
VIVGCICLVYAPSCFTDCVGVAHWLYVPYPDVLLHTYIHTYRNSPKRGTLKGANKRLMGNIQEATDTKSESSVEHDMNSSSTSEAGQLPADPIDKKHSEISQSESTSSTRTGSSPRARARKFYYILLHFCHLAGLLKYSISAATVNYLPAPS